MDDPTLSEEAKEKYAVVADKAIAMTESIKHSIVLLQVKTLLRYFDSEYRRTSLNASERD
jgi:hypothetical protein